MERACVRGLSDAGIFIGLLTRDFNRIFTGDFTGVSNRIFTGLLTRDFNRIFTGDFAGVSNRIFTGEFNHRVLTVLLSKPAFHERAPAFHGR